MANVYATKTGNWSDTTVWNTGALPTSTDDVFSNTYTVTIDQDVTVLSIRSTSATGITQGGGFACSTGRTVNCSSGSGFVTGTSGAVLLTLSHASGTTVTLKGTCTAGGVAGGHCLAITGTGTTNITGNIVGAGGTFTARAISIQANATVNVTGSVTASSNTDAVDSSASPTVTITGNLVGGASGSGRPLVLANSTVCTITGDITAGGSATGCWFGGSTLTITGNILASSGANGLELTGSTTTTTITGNVTGSSSGNFAGVSVANSAGQSVQITGTLTANANPAVLSAGQFPTLTVTGPFISGATGVNPVAWRGIVKLSPIATTEFRFLKSTGGTTSLYSADYGGQAAVGDVRYGTVYGTGNALTGTLRVPPANSVASGVAVDNTTGTAALLLNDVAAVVAAQIAATLGTPP